MSLSHDRFTDHARRTFERAGVLARRYGDRVTVDHLLLALLRGEENDARGLVRESGISLPVLRRRLVAVVGPGSDEQTGQLTLAGETQRAVALALAEAERQAYPCISTAHLLLGVASVRNTPAARLLADAGVTPGQLRAEMDRRIDEWRNGDGGVMSA